MIETINDHRITRAPRLEGERGVAMEYAIMLFLVSLAVAGFGDRISGAVAGVFEQVMTVLT